MNEFRTLVSTGRNGRIYSFSPFKSTKNELDITCAALNQQELGWNVDEMTVQSEPNCVNLHLYAHVLSSSAKPCDKVIPSAS